MTDREIMQQPLEAAPLSDYSKADSDFYRWWYSHMKNDLMQPPLNEVGYRVARYIWDAALRDRLAQPEQEPVFDCPRCGHCCPQRKPLTDEEIGKIAGETLDHWSCARAIEAAHGIKE